MCSSDLLEQVVPNTSVQQDLTHEDEYRDGKRREAVQGGEHRRPDDLEGKPEQEDQGDGGGPQGEGHGQSHAKDQHQEKNNQQEFEHLHRSPFRFGGGSVQGLDPIEGYQQKLKGQEQEAQKKGQLHQPHRDPQDGPH